MARWVEQGGEDSVEGERDFGDDSEDTSDPLSYRHMTNTATLSKDVVVPYFKEGLMVHLSLPDGKIDPTPYPLPFYTKVDGDRVAPFNLYLEHVADPPEQPATLNLVHTEGAESHAFLNDKKVREAEIKAPEGTVRVDPIFDMENPFYRHYKFVHAEIDQTKANPERIEFPEPPFVAPAGAIAIPVAQPPVNQ